MRTVGGNARRFGRDANQAAGSERPSHRDELPKRVERGGNALIGQAASRFNPGSQTRCLSLTGDFPNQSVLSRWATVILIEFDPISNAATTCNGLNLEHVAIAAQANKPRFLHPGRGTREWPDVSWSMLPYNVLSDERQRKTGIP